MHDQLSMTDVMRRSHRSTLCTPNFATTSPIHSNSESNFSELSEDSFSGGEQGHGDGMEEKGNLS